MEKENIKRGKPAPRRLMGLVFLIIAGILVLRQTGYPFPPWLFTWPVVLMIFALFVGIKHRFRDIGWVIMMLVGFAFLADIIWPEMQLNQYIVPGVLALLGLIFIFKPKSSARCGNNRFHRKMEERYEREYKRRYPDWKNPNAEDSVVPITTNKLTPNVAGDDDAFIDVVSIFSGVKRKILSKEFTGGDIVCVFGGAEINLTNSDFVSPIVLEMTQVFGGAKLIVPANWEIHSEISAVFGAVDDKRAQSPTALPDKKVILKGTVIFGGIEVNSY